MAAAGNDVIVRLSLALADRYRIERELGAGGMATVYLAEDLKHDRKVALKVLKPELAAVLGAERFVVEIKTTAALQHPHILPLFDSGTADGFLYYVMPYIEGETLRGKLNRETQLGVDESVRIASAIADALDYAHRHGVIHRDIKPENILLHDGRPMVADFGIALALSAAAGGRVTETGLSLGTPHYMSPEQATAEKEITGRSDVYSLGSVLYEMLTGNPPHVGSSAQQIIMKIITEEAQPVTTFRKSVPANVAAAVAKSLEKLPADRFESAHAFMEALNNRSFTTASAAFAIDGSPAATHWRKRALVAIALAVALGGLALVGFLRPTPPQPVVRYSMGLSAAQAMRQGVLGINIAFSPDGKSLVYVGHGEGGDQLWLRERDKLDATPLPGTLGAYSPVFSPDGSRIAFAVGSNVEVKVVPASGGPPITLVAPGAGAGGGTAWGPDGWIYFDSPDGLSRIRADGGTPELLIPYDTVWREIGHAWPQVLPNGKGLLYRSRRNFDPTDFNVVVFDLKTHERHVLTKGLFARYVEPGYLVFLRSDGVVMAAPFNKSKLKLTGPATPLFEGVMVKPFGSADVDISPSGTLAYVPGLSTTAGGVAELVNVTRDGGVSPLNPALNFNFSANRALSVSPDGKRVAIDVVGSGAPDIWVKQLPSGPFSRLTFGGQGAWRPQWTSDGQSVVYIGRPDTADAGVWKKRADGSSPAELVWRVPGKAIAVGDLSRDEQWLVYRLANTLDLYAVHLGKDTSTIPLLTESYGEGMPALSPDARWLAYVSNESGRDEVYVRPFPNVSSGRWQISTSGGSSPRWSRNGHDLFFESLGGDFMTAAISTTPSFSALEPRRLFSLPNSGIFGSAGAPYYDLGADDKSFIMVRISAVNQAPGAGQLVIVDNWVQELKAKMKAAR